MLEFILGFLLGRNNDKFSELIYEQEMEKQVKKSEYVPKYGGYYRNEGTYLDEDWKWIEPKFRKRYLNIYRTDGSVILKGSWSKYDDADEIYEYTSQNELNNALDFYSRLEDNNTLVVENNSIYLNVELKDKIIISVDKYRNNKCFECIACIDSVEVIDTLFEMKNHYLDYKQVDIIDNIQLGVTKLI